MMDILLLQFESALMAFGGPLIDDHDTMGEFPTRSMLTGLLANAQGWLSSDFEKLETLQDNLAYAVRCDREGRRIEDFQTVDTTQPSLQGAQLTSFGWTNGRGGTHYRTLIRFRHFLSDARFVVALTLRDGSLDEIEKALRFPRRPLYFGRKCCLPSKPVLLGRVEAEGLVEALRSVPVESRSRARWPIHESPDGRIVVVIEDRDWANGIHVGERRMKEGYL